MSCHFLHACFDSPCHAVTRHVMPCHAHAHVQAGCSPRIPPLPPHLEFARVYTIVRLDERVAKVVNGEFDELFKRTIIKVEVVGVPQVVLCALDQLLGVGLEDGVDRGLAALDGVRGAVGAMAEHLQSRLSKVGSGERRRRGGRGNGALHGHGLVGRDRHRLHGRPWCLRRTRRAKVVTALDRLRGALGIELLLLRSHRRALELVKG
mmetsp:Transcript_20125/g.59768  ORF Transcript_20125/g.59768 Transcript_20125/m.59768 type:complete len:207 (+) Transcript_20125:1826-2446(+)